MAFGFSHRPPWFSGLFAVLLSALLLLGGSGCAPVPVKTQDHAVTRHLALQRQQQLAAFEQWKLFGRIIASNGEEHWSGNLYWKQVQDTYLLRFSGPFGQGGFQIQGDERHVTLTDSRKQRITAATPRALLAKIDVPELPVRGMVYWSRGLPVPQAHGQRRGRGQGRGNEVENRSQVRYDELGRPLHIQQHDWDISYGDYQTVGEVSMPGRIEMQRSGQKVEWKFELSISKWTLQ